jgi:hypothetical protein
MAGKVRQPIDLASLERYISANVPEIQVPLDVKQVRIGVAGSQLQVVANETVVWVWTVEPDIPTDRQEWKEVCHEEEASGQASVKGMHVGFKSYN